MKTQIIQLSQKEDTISVKDKMSWCQTGRILLLWPEQGRVLTRQLDLTLIKRYANELGVELALVCSDPDVRYYAGKIGIPVFSSPSQAQDLDWKTDNAAKIDLRPGFLMPDIEMHRSSVRHYRPAWISHPVTRVMSLGASLLALIALALFIIPGARVVLTPKEIIQSLAFDLVADPSSQAVNISTGTLPTYAREVVVEGSEVISTTGTLTIPDATAHGDLLLTNETDQAVSIPPGTVVTTLESDPVSYVIDAVEVTTVKSKQSVVMPAHAVKKGSGSNLPPNSLAAIEGDLGMILSVTNPDSLTGGSDVQIESVAAQDLKSIERGIRERLKKEALAKIQGSLPEHDILVIPTVEILEVLEETSKPSIDQPGKQLEAFMRIRVQAQVVSNESIRSLVTPIFDASRQNGFSPVPGSLNISPATTQMIDGSGRIHWSILVTRRLAPDLPTDQLAYSVRGVTVPQAVERFSSIIPLEKTPEILTFPGWWPRLPLLAMRITLEKAVSP